ncbi:MAG: HDOD domain-containing protein [Opitutales bacterium]|nr:HDOD domain-containing protein [Opitutales bacterium]
MSIEEWIERLENLPPAPRVLPKLLKLLNHIDTSAQEIVDLIQLDASLTAKLIGISNSAYYGAGGTISGLDEAVNRLGFQEIYRTVNLICAKSFVGQSVAVYEIDSEERWLSSVTTAIVMETICSKIRMGDPATGYTIGLLHDIGKIAINQLFAEEYAEVLSKVEDDHMSLSDAEQEAFGFDHAEVGAVLLRKWDFPEEISLPIEFQFDPVGCKSQKEYASMLHLSRWVCASIAGAPGKHGWAFDLKEEMLDILKLSVEDIYPLMLDVKDKVNEKEDLVAL